MFKKVEIWILFLIILLNLPITILFGSLVRQELVGKKKLGKISEAALFLSEIPRNFRRIFITIKRADLEITEDRFPNLDGFNGNPNSQESYLLLSRYDGNLREGVVELIDLTNFEVLHVWNPDISKFNKQVNDIEFKNLDRDSNNSRSRLISPLLTKKGRLVFHDSTPLRAIDKCSNLVFQNTKDVFHHSIEDDSEGNLWVASHIYPQTFSSNKVGKDLRDDNGFLDDGIVKLDDKGEILFERSVAEIFIDNGLEYLLFSVGDRYFDIDPIHLNDIQPIDFNSAYWQKGDLFLSLRHQSMVLLYRPSTNKIIWKLTGPFFHQHDVDIIDESRISIFNNNSKDFYSGDIVDGSNEIIIYDFNTKSYITYLPKSFVKNDVRTITGGSNQILPTSHKQKQ